MLRFILGGGMLLCVLCVGLTMSVKALGWFVPEGMRLAFFADDGADSLYITAISRNLTMRLASEVYGTEISFSPNGELVFATHDFEIFSLTSSGDELRQLSPEGIRAVNPVWSPDGQQIAFLRVEQQNPQVGWLSVMNRDGQNVRHFQIEASTNQTYPIWLNEQQIYLFHSRNDSTGFRDLLIESSSGYVYDLHRTDQLAPSMISLGSTIAFALTASPNGRAIYLIHLLENGDTEVEQTPLFTIAPAASVFDFQWSPDESQLVFTLQDAGNYEITIFDSNGDLHNISRNPARDWNPAWSPDGQSIAFLSNRGGTAQMYVMNVDGSNLRAVANDVVSVSDWRPVWLP